MYIKDEAIFNEFWFGFDSGFVSVLVRFWLVFDAGLASKPYQNHTTNQYVPGWFVVWFWYGFGLVLKPNQNLTEGCTYVRYMAYSMVSRNNFLN